MDEFPFTLRLILVPVLLGINSFFAAAEVALVSIRETRMRQLADSGDSRARAVLALLANPDRLLSATQLGVTLASLGLGWTGEETVYRLMTVVFAPVPSGGSDRLLHLAAFAIAFGIITFLHMVVGEVVPKNLALERTERLALGMGPALVIFARATDFFIRFVERVSEILSRLLGLHGARPGAAHSVEELKLVVAASRRHGHMPASQAGMLHNVMDFYELTAREVMVPRNEIKALPDGATLDQVVRFLVEHCYSRLPVYEGTPEKILGILYARDIWIIWQEQRRAAAIGRPSRDFQLRTVLHPYTVVPETKPLAQLLTEFQSSGNHMAMVVDEFGTIVGLVTVEDVLEQIVGEIRDEHEVRPILASLEGPLELDGITSIRDLETLYDLRLPNGPGFETLAGFLLDRLGVIPKGGEQVDYEGRRFSVVEMSGNRIAKVRIEKLADEPVPQL